MSWVLILKELIKLLPSFIFILSITLPNLSITDVPFPALLSTLTRRGFQVKHATLLIPIYFPVLQWRNFTVCGTKVAPFPQLAWGVFFTACCLHIFSISIPPSTTSFPFYSFLQGYQLWKWLKSSHNNVNLYGSGSLSSALHHLDPLSFCHRMPLCLELMAEGITVHINISQKQPYMWKEGSFLTIFCCCCNTWKNV